MFSHSSWQILYSLFKMEYSINLFILLNSHLGWAYSIMLMLACFSYYKPSFNVFGVIVWLKHPIVSKFECFSFWLRVNKPI